MDPIQEVHDEYIVTCRQMKGLYDTRAIAQRWLCMWRFAELIEELFDVDVSDLRLAAKERYELHKSPEETQ